MLPVVESGAAAALADHGLMSKAHSNTSETDAISWESPYGASSIMMDDELELPDRHWKRRETFPRLAPDYNWMLLNGWWSLACSCSDPATVGQTA